MKKLLSVCLVLVMVICFGVTALAEGGFVNSPSLNSAPQLEGDDSTVIITPYSERHTLPDAERKALEDAYESINQAESLSDLNEKLSGNLAVSDLFNISSNSSKAQSLVLKADTLDNFKALMVYVDGEWKIVDAKIKDGKLVFTANDFGPYAIVVNTDGTKSPQTGINEVANTSSTSFVVYGIVMLASACGAFFMWQRSKKYSA